MNHIISGFAPPSGGQSPDTSGLPGFAGAVLPAITRPNDIPKFVELGICTTVQKYLSLLTGAGYRIGEGAMAIAHRVAVSPRRVGVRLITVPAGELGIVNGLAPYEEICERGAVNGLRLCPAELGFILRGCYREAGMGSIALAMQTITGKDGLRRAFFFEFSRDGRWLRASHIRPERLYTSRHRFIFALP
ncbi:MAG TPA: hypothetical protein VF803_00165 [Candidatus Paceibacterota bacterium]